MCSEPGSYGQSKKDVVIYSDPTDSKGYFHVSLTIKDLLHCRVKLYTSPVETCNNPTNVNKGLTGVPLSMYGYRYHSDKNLKIFSVGPFYFTGHKAAPTTPKYWSWSHHYSDDLACILYMRGHINQFIVWKLFPSKCYFVSLYRFYLIRCITNAIYLFGYVFFNFI